MSTEKKRKRPSRWQALLKRVVRWILCRAWLWTWAWRAARFALFLWNNWHRLKDDLWPFYDDVGVVHAERRLKTCSGVP